MSVVLPVPVNGIRGRVPAISSACVCVFVCMFVTLSVYFPVYLSLYLSVGLSIYAVCLWSLPLALFCLSLSISLHFVCVRLCMYLDLFFLHLFCLSACIVYVSFLSIYTVVASVVSVSCLCCPYYLFCLSILSVCACIRECCESFALELNTTCSHLMQGHVYAVC